MRTQFAIILIILVLLFVMSCATRQEIKVEAQNNFNANVSPIHIENSSPQIPAATIIEDITNKKAQNPTVSIQELADFGNQLLKQKGYNFDFNISNPKSIEKSAYKLQTIDGKEISVNFKQPENYPCGVFLSVPLLQVSEKEMRIISDGKEIAVNRPKDFFAEEIVLTNENLKGTIRKWFVPIDATPFGISADGKKIYFEYDFGKNYQR